MWCYEIAKEAFLNYAALVGLACYFFKLHHRIALVPKLITISYVEHTQVQSNSVDLQKKRWRTTI
jgi:hypothetical protein